MVLENIQVSSIRSPVLASPGGFGYLSGDSGISFAEMLLSPADSWRNEPSVTNAGPAYSDQSAADTGQIDMYAVDKLLNETEAQNSQHAEQESDENSVSARNTDSQKPERTSEDQVSIPRNTAAALNSGETELESAKKDRDSRPDSQTAVDTEAVSRLLESSRQLSGSADRQGSEDGQETAVSENLLRTGLSAGSDSDADEIAGNAEGSKSENAEVAGSRETLRTRQAQNLTDKTDKSNVRDRLDPEAGTADSAVGTGNKALAESSQGGREEQLQDNVRSETGSQSSAAERQDAEGKSRKSVLQVVDLRESRHMDQPDRLSRIERFRAQLRSESNGSQLRTAASGNPQNHGGSNSGSSFSGRDGQQSQQGQMLRDSADSWFRGGSEQTASGTDNTGSFQSVFQRMITQPAHISMADSARLLSTRMQEHLNSDIVKQAKFVLKDGDAGEIRLRLRPADLGSVHIQLDLQDNVIAARIFVENSSVQQVFEQQMAELAEAFAEAGLDLGSVEVSVNNGETSGDQREPGQARDTARALAADADRRGIEALGDSVQDLSLLYTPERLINLMA